jgi:uncharacterized membrane protein YgdD (TMEM256/DUF423 family)
MPAPRLFVLLGSALGFLGVAAGAFGAHALKTRVGPELLAVFETGVRYQLLHALALLAAAAASDHLAPTPLAAAAWLFVAGSAIFSGSLYALTLTGTRLWGAVTPVGGLLLLGGWLALGASAFK